jgi:hypothetical protein
VDKNIVFDPVSFSSTDHREVIVQSKISLNCKGIRPLISQQRGKSKATLYLSAAAGA